MESTRHDKLTPLLKFDSTVVLERVDSTASSCAYLRHESAIHSTSGTDNDKTDDVERGNTTAPLAPVGLDVSIRFGRVALLMVLAMSALVAFTIAFKSGVVLGHFDPDDHKDPDAAQKRVVDDYNSYTGNVVALFGRPIEIFVALAVQVVLMRVIASSLLRTEIDWKTDLFILAITAFVGFLISNGLNALNVQPQPPVIKPVISAIDLTYVPDSSTSGAALRSTNLSQTFSERSPSNPITNTVLRNLVLPRVPPKAFCIPNTNLIDFQYSYSDLGLEYGFSQRDWQSRLLQEAPNPKQLRWVINPSNKTANQFVKARDLPMDASLAADLYVHSMLTAPYYLRWASMPFFVNAFDPPVSSDSVARYAGLLPPTTSTLNEAEQREWFLPKCVKNFTETVKGTDNISHSDVIMEFSHVEVLDHMHFDAFTFEVEVDPARFPGTRSGDYPSALGPCGSFRTCLIRNPNEEAEYDPPPQVQVFGTCVAANGKEELTFTPNIDSIFGNNKFLYCTGSSNTSLMVMSIGKRFAADSLSGKATNLRRIYTYTIGKLSWTQSNLTKEFHAMCDEVPGSCNGLRFPLDPTPTNPSERQELVVGVDALTTNLVAPMDLVPYDSLGSFFLPLVRVYETPSLVTLTQNRPYLATDPLLYHNAGKVTGDRVQFSTDRNDSCDRFLEERIQLALNNHMYIEHGLQTAYTAAAFFLLQNGVVKNVILLEDNKTSLNFQNNTETIALLASIPAQNAWLTLTGCALLVLGLGAVLVWAWATSEATTSDRCGGLGHVNEPHVVARVMLDSTHFPPLFLHRRVVGETTAKPTPSVDGFVIDGLALQPAQTQPTAEHSYSTRSAEV